MEEFIRTQVEGTIKIFLEEKRLEMAKFSKNIVFRDIF